MRGKKRLLLVEDNAELREALREALEGRGWSVVAVSSGEEALASWAGAGPDAVVTDYRMGDIDGLDLARVLRSKVRIPIVIFTAELTAGLKNEAQALEVIAVPKGDLDSLMSALDLEVPFRSAETKTQ